MATGGITPAFVSGNPTLSPKCVFFVFWFFFLLSSLIVSFFFSLAAAAADYDSVDFDTAGMLIWQLIIISLFYYY